MTDGGLRPRVGVFLRETCKICNEADPTVAYFWTGGRVSDAPRCLRRSMEAGSDMKVHDLIRREQSPRLRMA